MKEKLKSVLSQVFYCDGLVLIGFIIAKLCVLKLVCDSFSFEGSEGKCVIPIAEGYVKESSPSSVLSCDVFCLVCVLLVQDFVCVSVWLRVKSLVRSGKAPYSLKKIIKGEVKNNFTMM